MCESCASRRGREREDWEDNKRLEREHKEFLERSYRHKLLQQQGLEVKPAGFQVAAQSPYDPGSRLHLYANLYADCMIVAEDDAELAESLTGLKAGAFDDSPLEEE